MAAIDIGRLSGHGMGELRRKALAVATAGLDAADGGAALRSRMKLTDDGVEIDGHTHPLGDDQRLLVIGGGKASLSIAIALEEILGDRIDGGAIVLKRGETNRLGRLEGLIGDHPLPSPDSVRSAERIRDIALSAREGDLVVTCFTGGRSALLSLPPAGVRFEDKLQLNQLLLASGMPIGEINTVRKHVSEIKGGRLASMIAPARILNLTVSDVAGDRLDVLADLTTQDSSEPADALGILQEHGLLERISPSIRRHLESPEALSPNLDGMDISTLMLVNGESVCEAMADHAEMIGFVPVKVSTTLEGEAHLIGERVAHLALGRLPLPGHERFPAGTVLLGCGGEATVKLDDSTFGRGGPNQEAALAAGLTLDGHPVAAAFLDTDGSDGGTSAAGAICDGDTAERAAELDLSLSGAIQSHTSSEPLEKLGDLIQTGSTGTNVNDLFVAVVGEHRKAD